MKNSQERGAPSSLADAGALWQWAAYRHDVAASVVDCVWIYDATAQTPARGVNFVSIAAVG